MVQMKVKLGNHAIIPANSELFAEISPAKRDMYANLAEERQDFLRFFIGQNKQIIHFAREFRAEKIRLEGVLHIS